MLAGAGLTLITGQISPADAITAIDQGVMIFLLGMFIIGEGVKSSGLLEDCMRWICTHARTGDMVLASLILTMGLLSAILMNDTIAIIGAPLVIILAEKFQISKQGALIALCFAVTTGSVFSPIGNPQNYLIASYVPQMSPYTLFIGGLFFPTILSLGVVFLFLRPLFKPAKIPPDNCIIPEPADRRERFAVFLSFILIFIGIGFQVLYGLTGYGWPLPLEWIAIGAAVPVLIWSSDRLRMVKNIDWHTLIFFAALFVLMQSVYNTGFFQQMIPDTGNQNMFLILATGIIFSQFISNVPFVALFQPVLLSPGVPPQIVLALAAGSTIAGNLTILGAASNVIIIQQAEKRGIHVPMSLFCTYGIPVTLTQTAIYAIFLTGYPIIGA